MTEGKYATVLLIWILQKSMSSATITITSFLSLKTIMKMTKQVLIGPQPTRESEMSLLKPSKTRKTLWI